MPTCSTPASALATSSSQVNPEFGSEAAARVEVDAYAADIGRLPAVLLSNLAKVHVNAGRQAHPEAATFQPRRVFGGNRFDQSITIHTGTGEEYRQDGFLEAARPAAPPLGGPRAPPGPPLGRIRTPHHFGKALGPVPRARSPAAVNPLRGSLGSEAAPLSRRTDPADPGGWPRATRPATLRGLRRARPRRP